MNYKDKVIPKELTTGVVMFLCFLLPSLPNVFAAHKHSCIQILANMHAVECLLFFTCGRCHTQVFRVALPVVRHFNSAFQLISIKLRLCRPIFLRRLFLCVE